MAGVGTRFGLIHLWTSPYVLHRPSAYLARRVRALLHAVPQPMSCPSSRRGRTLPVQVVSSCSPKIIAADDLRRFMIEPWAADATIVTAPVLETGHSGRHLSDVDGMVHTPIRLTVPFNNHGNGEGALGSIFEIPTALDGRNVCELRFEDGAIQGGR